MCNNLTIRYDVKYLKFIINYRLNLHFQYTFSEDKIEFKLPSTHMTSKHAWVLKITELKET